jgi:hypothetical protein
VASTGLDSRYKRSSQIVDNSDSYELLRKTMVIPQTEKERSYDNMVVQTDVTADDGMIS